MALDTKEQVEQWLDDVVIGLNLCPFAAKPRRQKAIHIDLFGGETEQLIPHLLQALQELDEIGSDKRETTLLVMTQCLTDFHDYNQFLDEAEWALEQGGWVGTYQIASFHPDYQFAGTGKDDAENLTNRAPYPILHLIREDSLASVLERYDNPEEIPENNIKRMEALTQEEKQRLFPYLIR
jgi:hypothetical protein